jgi:hypothetical protein
MVIEPETDVNLNPSVARRSRGGALVDAKAPASVCLFENL